MRIKYRYVICQILLDGKDIVIDSNSNPVPMSITSRDIIHAIREKVQILYGDIGYGELQTSNIKYFEDKVMHVFVVRVPEDKSQSIYFTLSCITSIKQCNNIVIRVITIASCERTCKTKLLHIFQRFKSNLTGQYEFLSHHIDESLELLSTQQF